MPDPSSKRKRALSLRTQLFNKRMYERFNDNDIELEYRDEIGEEEDQELIEDIDEEEEDNELENDGKPTLFTKLIDAVLNRKRIVRSKDGRRIPIALDHETAEYRNYACKDGDLLMDERFEKPYVDNRITSSTYTIYSFLPLQIYAQFSKIGNVYFLLVAILQMLTGFSTTSSYTRVVLLCIFMGIPMAREAYEDFERHLLDREENDRVAKVLRKTSTGYNNFTGLNNNQSKIPFQGQLDTRFHNFKLLSEHHGVNIEKEKWKDLRVGDFVLLNQDDPVPADLLLLTTDGDNNECLVETIELNGETNLKTRQPSAQLGKLAGAASGLANINAEVLIEDPNLDLSNFEGKLDLENHQTGKTINYPLNIDNVILRGSILRNTKNVIGMVIFTGEETKIRMNIIGNPRLKAPKLQGKVNSAIIFMVILVVVMSLFSHSDLLFNKQKYLYDKQTWYLFQKDGVMNINILSVLVNYNTIIPLLLYAAIEVIKLMQSKLMEWDIDMYHPITDTPFETRTTTTLEDLGQVSHIFCDKTGTLTKNKVLFRKFSLCGGSFIHDAGSTTSESQLPSFNLNEDFETVSLRDREIVGDHNYESNLGRNSTNIEANSSLEYKGNDDALHTWRAGIRPFAGEEEASLHSCDSHKLSGPSHLKSSLDLIKFIQLHPHSLFAHKARFFFLSLALCHDCSFKKCNLKNSGGTKEDLIEYQSSSPDELALITAAKDLGYIALNRNGKILTIKSFPNGFEEEPVWEDYEIMETIGFNSDRKRMSVLIKMPNEPNRILLICKGADEVILERITINKHTHQKMEKINIATERRKRAQAEIVLKQRRSLAKIATGGNVRSTRFRLSLLAVHKPSLSLKALKRSLSRKLCHGGIQVNSIDQFLDRIRKNDQEIEDVSVQCKRSLQKNQKEKYGNIETTLPVGSHQKLATNNSNNSTSDQNIRDYIGSEELIINEGYLLERTLQAIDEFSTEGLRTMLYGYKWIDMTDYVEWKMSYNAAESSFIDPRKVCQISEKIENDLSLIGATAIEDKLQDEVVESIQNLGRAGIKMWMLTGDKRETAISVGYSCQLIHDYSTVVILTENDENIISKMNALSQELDSNNIAHGVVVIDGDTLTVFESNPTVLSVFIELCTRTDSVICCRSSPSQKAMMVTAMKNFNNELVTLAIGDGANDIPMLRSADIGIGITGKEGLQASKSSDYSIAQFKFLTKLLLTHGRYNYIRTSKFVLCIFYEQLVFYMSQIIFQKYTMFSASSIYDSLALSIFTLLPILFIGIFEWDLKPLTLLMVPELYATGRLNKGFNLSVFFQWTFLGVLNSLLITFSNITGWGESAPKDNSSHALGIINCTSIVLLINLKLHFVDSHNHNWLALASTAVSVVGWFVWCFILPPLNDNGFFYDITFWYAILVFAASSVMLEVIYNTVKIMVWPTNTDIFRYLEAKDEVRKKFELDIVT